MADRYQSRGKKSTKKFEVMGSKEMAVRLPLPLVEVWEELQPEVEHLTGLAGLKIIRAVIEDEVMRRVGPRHQPDPGSSCLRWGQRQWMFLIVPILPSLMISTRSSKWNIRQPSFQTISKPLTNEFTPGANYFWSQSKYVFTERYNDGIKN